MAGKGFAGGKTKEDKMQKIKMKTEGQTLRVSLACELDHHSAKAIREKVDKRLEEGGVRRLVLDFSGVGFMDSSGIGLIIGRADKAQSIGAEVEVAGLLPQLKKIVRLSGISKLPNLTVSD